jgi:hypothetical protein
MMPPAPSFAAKVTKLDTTKTQNQIRSETLDGRTTGIISFGIISKTSTQCTGYPLAIADAKKSAIQPLFQRRDRRSINPMMIIMLNQITKFPNKHPLIIQQSISHGLLIHQDRLFILPRNALPPGSI